MKEKYARRYRKPDREPRPEWTLSRPWHTPGLSLHLAATELNYLQLVGESALDEWLRFGRTSQAATAWWIYGTFALWKTSRIRIVRDYSSRRANTYEHRLFVDIGANISDHRLATTARVWRQADPFGELLLANAQKRIAPGLPSGRLTESQKNALQKKRRLWLAHMPALDLAHAFLNNVPYLVDVEVVDMELAR